MPIHPLLSVIVPIYKIDQYLGICIESLIHQTYRNLEIILVDDGSPDRCTEICDLYARKDDRIKVIHKANGGLVSARKAGINTATRDYVGYVDGDDWVGPAFYEKMMERLCETQSDVVVGGHSRDLFASSATIPSNIPSGVYDGERLTELKKNMLSYGKFFRNGISTYVWNKVFKRERLLKYQNAVDDTITIGEDAAVVYPYLMECQRVCVVDCFDYHYRQREDSMLKKSASYADETVRLHALHRHLQNFVAQYEETYGLQEQVDDFLLGVCIIRSGGVLQALQDKHSSFDQSFKGKNVVVWSAGTFGQQLVNRIKENRHCHIAGWLDEDCWEYRRCCMDVDPVDTIDDLQFDYVLIATIDGTMAESIKAKLIWRGVPEGKILTVQCQKAKRSKLLENYLSIGSGTQA